MRRSEVVQEWTLQRAVGKLLDRLSRSDLSSHEARKYLGRKGCPADLGQQAVAHCLERGYLDDARVASALLQKAERQSWSLRKLKESQWQRQVEVAGELDEESSCLQLAHRWLERGYPPDKVAARLQRRGFSFSSVRRALEIGVHGSTDEAPDS